ncbi:MAG: IPT/TIG domain-containing protein [Planctomycetes bacterium]|nr:IPT/TIG domain-containing protein [Planctomycetota bacterium]
MISRVRRCLSPAALGLVLLAASCDPQTEVESTIPASNAEDVDPRTIVAIQLSNSITERDLEALDPRNFTVTGDLTEGPYAGTLVLAKRSKLTRDQTVEEFRAENAGGALGGGGQVAGELPDQGKDAGTGNTTTKTTTPKKDTIVFLLPAGTRFKDGERVHVSLRSDVTANRTPIRRHKSFSFRVRGGAGATGDLKVVSTDPRAGETLVASRPRIAVAFNRAVKKDGLADAIVVRGRQSGVHVGGATLFSRTEGQNGVKEVVRRLASGDAFEPGETVNVTLSSAITDLTAASPTSPAEGLQPFKLVFQAQSGTVRGGWTAIAPGASPGAPAAVVAADFRPAVDGVECVIVGSSAAALLSQSAERIWTRVDFPLPLDTPAGRMSVVDAVAYDMKDDGVPEVVVIAEGAGGSRVLALEVTSSGALAAAGKPVDMPVGELGPVILADLDSNGKPEIILTHAASRYVPGEGEKAVSTGTLTFLELKLVPPDLSTIDPSKPETALPVPQFQPLHDAIRGFGRSSLVEAADLNADGKLDLIAEAGSSLLLFRNIGAPRTAFAFREVGRLAGRSGGPLGPLAWAAGDFDEDGDQDVLSWDAEGALLHRNSLVGPEPSGGADGSARGLLAEATLPEPLEDLPRLSGRAVARALEIDGRDGLDLVVEQSGGGFTILLGDVGDVVLFEAFEQPGAGLPAGFAVADLDGDTGLDIASAFQGGEVRFYVSEDVDEPSVAPPSSFRFAEDGSGLTDLSGAKMRVAVLGDLTEQFVGYSLALDYDEKLLSYKGFEAPEDFQRTASFTLCPDAALVGCAGFASAKMAYRENTRGAPSVGVLLGTLLFERTQVATRQTAKIELKAFAGPNNASFDNTVSVQEGTAAAVLPVTIEGDPLTVVLEPPAPPDLVVQCSVEGRGDTSLSGRVTWSSPSGVIFSQLEVQVAGGTPATLPGTESSFAFETSLTGAIPVTVTGRTAGREVARAGCQVIGIHRPAVTCAPISPTQNNISWSLSHAVDRFSIYRNGVRIFQTFTGDVREHIDSSASPDGAEAYEVAGLISGVEGPRGRCDPIGDPSSGTTLPPQITEAVLLPRTKASDPNMLRFRWANGEGYSKIRATLSRASVAEAALDQDLDGTATELTFSGDPARGGVRPDQYTLRLVGHSGGTASDPALSRQVSVPVPGLDVPLACVFDGLGGVRLTWTDVWRGYGSLVLAVERQTGDDPPVPVEQVPLDFASTSHTVQGLAPVGVYTFRLRASYTDPLPPALVPSAQSLERSCSLSFAPRVLVGRLEAGVGMAWVEIPVKAEAFGLVKGFRFELEHPSFLAVDPAAGLKVEHPGARVEEFSLTDGSVAGTRKATVKVSGVDIQPDAAGGGAASGQIVLATLVGSVPLDLTLAGEHALRFRGEPSLDFGDLGDTPVEADSGGKLVIRRRFIAIDRVTLPAGSQDVVTLGVRATFDAPASFPSYRLNAFTVHVKFDPKLLELLPVFEEDQRDAVVAGKGTYFLPNDVSIATANVTGDLKVAWFAFRFANPTAPPDYLYPGAGLALLFLRLRSKVPGDSPTTFAAVDFVSDPKADNPTTFFPEVDVPSEPDLEGFFGGGVHLVSSVVPFTVKGISPAEGSLLGGNEAVVTGTGFLSGGGTPADVSVQLVRLTDGGAPVPLPATEILSVESSRIRFVVPDSGLRQPPRLETPADVQVTTRSGKRTLPAAYVYQFPRLSGADLKSGRASGGDLMVIQGSGLAPSSTVEFIVPGAAPFAAQVSRVDSDGRRLLVLTPDLRGHEGKRATIKVTVPGVAALTLPDAYEVLRDSGGPVLKITSVTPPQGTICGGLEVTIAGEGFLANLAVRFGSFQAQSVVVDGGTKARARTPSVPEGTAAVTVSVANGDGPAASLPGAFTYRHPAPAFVRGDVDESLKVDISDVTLLSALVLGKSAQFPSNLDAADANDDGVLDGGDVTAILAHLFGGVQALPDPFKSPGLDPTPDRITSCDE